MDKKEQYLVFLMILLTTVSTIQVFKRGEYQCCYLILQILAAVVFGWFFGRRREKRNWAFFLAGGALLGIWSYAVAGLNPPLHDLQLAESSLHRLDLLNTAEIYAVLPYAHLHREAIPAAVTVLLLTIYLAVWSARFSAAGHLGTLLRLVLFASLPVVLLPMSLVLSCPFLSDRSLRYACFLPPAQLTAAGLSLVLILILPLLTVLKKRPGWKRVLAAYGILILISLSVWGIFYGIQAVRRARTLARLAAEGRPMTLEAFYARRKNAKDGTKKLSELFAMMEKPNFDTGDFPFNSSFDWIARNASGNILKPARKDEMIRVSEGPSGEKLTAGIAELAKYDQIRFNGSYTDFNSFGPVLNNIRRMVRTGAARAAIAHYTGKTELILPRLKAVTPASRLLEHQPLLICGLVYANLDLILGSQVVALGPNGPQYADDYRFFLDWIHSRDYSSHAWRETEICAELLKDYDHGRKLIGRLNPVIFFLIRPLLIETAFRYLRMALRREKYLAENHDLPPEDLNRPSFLRVMGTKGVLETAFALKLYRSLHGKYPDSTAALVPEILASLPLDPVTGKPFRYVLKKDHFELFSEAFNRGTPLLISEPRY